MSTSMMQGVRALLMKMRTRCSLLCEAFSEPVRPACHSSGAVDTGGAGNCAGAHTWCGWNAPTAICGRGV